MKTKVALSSRHLEIFSISIGRLWINAQNFRLENLSTILQLFSKNGFVFIAVSPDSALPVTLYSLNMAWCSLIDSTDDVLSPALKRTEPPLKDRKSADSRFSPSEQLATCRVLNTADYCHRTAMQVRCILHLVIKTQTKSLPSSCKTP